MMLNLGNNAFYGVFMPLHHSLGFLSMILEGGLFYPHDPPWIRPGAEYLLLGWKFFGVVQSRAVC